ncbi:lymphoid-restricted membrane protein-like [Solea senegalensis]|uniref:Lymphoid-restricted membrane protein-like n=2 Tax=Solea senegalensis TaxID=28829 RepID=A0AAV6SWG7_SOLSE|nr:inositol 1,4,5-triphosphate receptor associated 2 [Solea senegalensis]KAG7521348.1 lymphoid-restricted membrane protein-like [Solea senegalensis]
MMERATNEADAETQSYSLSTMLGSEDSEEETSQEDSPLMSWNELSIIERVGLNSVEMSEKDLETAFSHITLAFRCDQYTLKQRLQAEEHARNLAEENIQLELTRGRETLETLKGLCLDSKRSKILQRLELSLDILGGTVERISNTAEVLGAVHQEARVTRAVELMVAHVESLRRRHDRNVAELQETKKMIQQQNSCRYIFDPRVSSDPGESDNILRCSQRNSGRRRISVSVISSQTQEKRKRDLRKRSGHKASSSRKSCPSPSMSSESSYCATNKDESFLVDDGSTILTLDSEGNAPEESATQLPPDPAAVPSTESPDSKQVVTRKIQNKNASLDTLRQRHKDKAVLTRKKSDKNKKSTNVYARISVDTNGSWWTRHPLSLQMNRRHWLLSCLYVFVLFCVIVLTFVLWKVHDEAFEP